jgi:hypothetical protein
MGFQPRREPSTIYGTDNINERESARFVSSNLSVPRSLLTTTLRTDRQSRTSLPGTERPVRPTAGSRCSSRLARPVAPRRLGLPAAVGYPRLRREVLTVLNTLPASSWTDTQRAAASTASASYDLVGTLLKSGVVDKGPIIQNYGASIVRCHEVCAPMIFRASAPTCLTPLRRVTGTTLTG